MPVIQGVLAQGGTSALDFTLHDSGHAFRVAQRMEQVIPIDVLPRLSSYELALLLLSAYLHDIGMTPERRKVNLHYQFLLTANSGELTQEEIKYFQEWLDLQGRGITPPISTDKPSIDNLRLADELTTYYCRHRHNDWSEEWIWKNLSGEKLGTYVDWMDDLVTLCRSHHYGYSELTKSVFNPKLVGAPSKVVHLRFLACALRISDILEFDPERTPNVILKHRDISPSSLIFWWKDHHISIVQEDYRLIVSARPPSAYIHRAVEATIEQVDEELRLCRTIADEMHFEKCPGLASDLPHRWDLLPSVHKDIRPKDDRYEYINGAFRPDTHRVLELLSGIELYGSPLTAIRELLQNAFDAVREQIAYQRLTQPVPSDPSLEMTLGHLHRVELRIEPSDDAVWLICSDTGVGMTKTIIRDHLLISGAPKHRVVLELERRCKDAGFALGRTGQFGIGVLSYFMLADLVIIKTRRSQEPGDVEKTGWYFESEGIGSFGELRRDSTLQRGTEVHLRLRPSIVLDDLQAWIDSVKSYLENLITFVPCTFQFKSSKELPSDIVYSPGWVSAEHMLSKIVVPEVLDTPNDYLELVTGGTSIPHNLASTEVRNKATFRERIYKELLEKARNSLRWKVQHGVLPDDIGRYSIHLPYFQLPGGNSLGFLNVVKEDQTISVEATAVGNYLDIHTDLILSWHGIKVSNDWELNSLREISKVRQGIKMMNRPLMSEEPMNQVVVVIDFNSVEAGSIAVNRDQFIPSDKARATMKFIAKQTEDLLKSFLLENKNSAYAVYNSRCCDYSILPDMNLQWVCASNSRMTFRNLSFPLIISSPYIAKLERSKALLQWRGVNVSVAERLRLIDLEQEETYMEWCSNLLAPDSIVVLPHYKSERLRFEIRPLWTHPPTGEDQPGTVGLMCLFPTEWNNIIGIEFKDYSGSWDNAFIYNSSHQLLRDIDAAGWEWCEETFKSSIDPFPFKDILLGNKSRAAGWLVKIFTEWNEEGALLWKGIMDHDPSFISELWRMLFSTQENRGSVQEVFLCSVFASTSSLQLEVLYPNSWKRIRKDKDIEKYLPMPRKEWQLEIT